MIATKMKEFLDLKQGNMLVLQYAGKFNNLALYVGHHADSNEKKRECFTRGLPMIMQRELFLGNYQSFLDLLNAAITLETLSKGAQSELG